MDIILHDDVRLNLNYLNIIHIDIDLLTSNGLIIESRYYDFTDNTCIVIIFNCISHSMMTSD